MAKIARDLVPWTARDVAEMTARYSEEHRRVLCEIARYTDERLHGDRMALVDLLTTDSAPDWTTISRVFAGTYDKPDTFIRTRCVPALKVIRSNMAGHVVTPVVQEITDCLELWSQQHVMAEIVGPAGRSKTHTCREWHLDHPDSVYLDCPTEGGLGAFLRELARQVQVSTSGTLDALSEGIRAKMDKRNTLIVDEVARILPSSANPRNPQVKMLNFLQRLHDLQGVTVVFVATDIFDDTFSDWRLRKYLAQLHRRIIYRLEIPKVTKAEILAIARGFLADVDPGDEQDRELLTLCLEIGSTEDGIGPLFAYLQNARLLADGRGERLSAGHLRTAAKYARNRADREAKRGAA